MKGIGVSEQEEQKRSKDLEQKVEAARQQSFMEEMQRFDGELDERARQQLRQIQSQREDSFQAQVKKAEEEHLRVEETIRSKEEELHRALGQEREKKREAREREEIEVRRRQEAEQRRKEDLAHRKAEEELRRQSELARRKSEEEERRRREEESHHRAETDRRKREDELRKQEEARRIKEEEERKRKEEEKRKKEEEARQTALEQQRKEEEKRQKEEEKQKEESERKQRTEVQIAKGRSFFSAGDYEHALVEVAKALVNDPMNVDALDLEQKIKEAQNTNAPQEIDQPSETTEPKPKPKPKVKIKKAKQTFRAGQKSPGQKRNNTPILIGIAIAAVVIITIVFFILKKPVQPPQIALVINPFGSTSNSLEESLLGSSLAEEVTERFQRLTAVTATGFSSSYGLKQQAAAAGFSIVHDGPIFSLTGTVSRSGDTIAIALHLIDSVGKTAWSDGIIEPMEKISQVPDEISAKVADAMNIPSSGRTDSFLHRRESRNTDAYQMYLRGLEISNRMTIENRRSAVALFEQALQHEPKFSEAYAAEANILIEEYEKGWTSYDTALGRARQLAESAISSDPAVSKGYIVLGELLSIQKDFKEATANFTNALKLSPNNSIAHLDLSKVLLQTGKTKEATDEFNEAYRLDPFNPDVLEFCGIAQQFLHAPRLGMTYHQTALRFAQDSVHYIIGPIADAVASDPDLSLTYNGQVIGACESGIAANPNDFVTMYRLARLKQLLGVWQEANVLLKNTIEVLRKDIREHPKDGKALVYLALTLTRLGQFPEAINYSRQALEIDPRNAEVHYAVAQMYSLQMYSGKKKEIDPNKKEEAVQALKQALAIHYRFDQLINADFFNLRDIPEYQSLIEEPAE